MERRTTSLRIMAAAASGLLVVGLFPPFHLQALVWIALIPLLAALWSLDGSRLGRKGFLLGSLAGWLTSMGQFHWFSEVAFLAALIIPFYLALFWGLFGAFAATWGNPWRSRRERGTLGDCLRSLRYGFCVAVVWAGIEWLRSWWFTGFGWNSLGVAFHSTLVMAQAADLLGVIGLSIVPVFFQTVLLQAARRMMEGAQTGKRRTRLDFGIAALIVGLFVCYGLVRMAMEAALEKVRVKTLLVQINIPQENARVMWEALDVHLAYEEETLKGLNAITEGDNAKLQEAIETSESGEISLNWPDWVMWPEAALCGSILITPDGRWGTWEENTKTIERVREAGPFQLVYGITEFEGEKHDEDDSLVLKDHGQAWNSLAVMGPENDLQTYRKHHLVLFGETIPLVDRLPFLKKIYEQQSGLEFGGSFTPGVSLDPLPIPTAAGSWIDAIPTICFEDSVPRLVRKFVRPSPQVIVNVTNDGWFKESAASAQHFANARFRAIELRRPMLRCANNGVSAAVDSTGSTAHPDTGKPQCLVDEKGSHFTRGSLLVALDVPLHPSTTLYAMIGDWGVIGLALLGLGLSRLKRDQISSMQSP